MNFHAIAAIYKFEMARAFRTLAQSLAAPVISSALYFIVFGSAIGNRMTAIDGVEYGSFIVPGLIMLTVLMQSVTNAAFGIYIPKFMGSIYELMSAPVSAFEIVIGYVGAAATKSLMIAVIILFTAQFFVDLQIAHPVWMVVLLITICVSFSLFGFIVGVWAKSFDQLNMVPMLILTPLIFLGGSFYSISMLPPFWQVVTLFNPVVYLISVFRWSFFGTADVGVGISLLAILLFTSLCLAIISWIFRTGYRIRS